MMPLHPGFRRLVLQNIPKLERKDLNDYDGLLALRLDFVHRRSHVDGAARKQLDVLIAETTQQANKIIAPYRKQFDALHKLWSARRNFALHQGGMLQIPSSWEELKGFAGALGGYLLVQVHPRILWLLATARFKNPFDRRDNDIPTSPRDPDLKKK